MRTGGEVTGRQMMTLVLLSAGVCLDAVECVSAVCVCVLSEMYSTGTDVEGQLATVSILPLEVR